MKLRLHVIPILLLILTLVPRSMQAAPLAFATPTAETTKQADTDPQARIAEITQNDPTLSDDFSRNNGNWSTKSDDKDLTFAYKDRSFHMRVGKDNFSTWRTNTEGLGVRQDGAAGRIGGEQSREGIALVHLASLAGDVRVSPLTTGAGVRVPRLPEA